MPHVRRVVDREGGDHVQAYERRNVHDDVPAVGAVLIGSEIAVEELFEVEFLFGRGRLDALFDKESADDETAAEEHAEDDGECQPELRRGHVGHEEVAVLVDECLDEEKGKHIGKSARRRVEHQFHGVGVVALLE